LNSLTKHSNEGQSATDSKIGKLANESYPIIYSDYVSASGEAAAIGAKKAKKSQSMLLTGIIALRVNFRIQAFISSLSLSVFI